MSPVGPSGPRGHDSETEYWGCGSLGTHTPPKPTVCASANLGTAGGLPSALWDTVGQGGITQLKSQPQGDRQVPFPKNTAVGNQRWD